MWHSGDSRAKRAAGEAEGLHKAVLVGPFGDPCAKTGAHFQRGGRRGGDGNESGMSEVRAEGRKGCGGLGGVDEDDHRRARRERGGRLGRKRGGRVCTVGRRDCLLYTSDAADE